MLLESTHSKVVVGHRQVEDQSTRSVVSGDQSLVLSTPKITKQSVDTSKGKVVVGHRQVEDQSTQSVVSGDHPLASLASIAARVYT